MPFLTKGDINWKFIAIVLVLTVIAGGGTLLLSKFNQTAFSPIESQKPEEVERLLGPYPAPHIEVEATIISVFLDDKMRLPDVLPQDKVILKIDEIIDWQYGKSIDIQVGDEVEMGLQYSARPAKLLWDLPPICPEGYELVLSGCVAEAPIQDLDTQILAPEYEDLSPRLEQNFIVYSKPQKPEDYLEGRVKERVLPGIEQGDKIRIIIWDSLYPIGVYELVETDNVQTNNDWLTENEIVSWQIYKNEEYGFEIKYLSDWEKGEIPGADSDLLFNINFIEPIPESRERVFWPGSFRIRIFPNVEQLSLEEWMKGYKRKAATGVDLIRETTDTILNEKNAKKVSVFGFDHIEIVIIAINNEMIYKLSFDDAGLNDPDRYQHQQIYDQMLSNFRFIEIKKEELEKKETLRMINGLVKGGEEFCKERNLPYKEALKINLGPGGGGAIFVSCFGTGFGAAYVLEWIDNEWKIIWSEKASGKMVRAPEVIDVEDNGIHQIYWLKGGAGGTCACYSLEASIYYIHQKQEYYLYRGGCFDAQCEYIIQRPFIFSENLKKAKHPSREWKIKQYLLEKDAERAKNYANLSSGVGIAFPNGGEALILGETYFVSVITTLSEEEYISRTGEIGVALWKGEERLGFIFNRPSEFFFEWKAGEYRTTEGKKETAAPGEDYLIQLYSGLGLEDFSDRNFALIEDEE